MTLTQRQQDILGTAVSEYIRLAQPVSSNLLEKYFDISPATIRNEMQVLSEQGFLLQPYTSAGRVPTDKGYRFVVDALLEQDVQSSQSDFSIDDIETRDAESYLNTTRLLAKQLSDASSSFAAMLWRDVFWKEGWETLFQEPEFGETESILHFAQFIEDFEANVRNLSVADKVQAYIGKENPFSKIKDFSIIMAECVFPGNERIVVALMGPKRMEYQKNIQLLHSLVHLFH